jgi:Rrf2 family protein
MSTPYGKTAQYAIAAMTQLAKAYLEKKKLNAADIAQTRNLPKPVVAKVLTVLSQAGLVIGSPGPGGGYALAKPPEGISLYDVAELFDRQEEALGCPMGPNYCGAGPECPFHNDLSALRENYFAFLKNSTFDSFVEDPGTPLELTMSCDLQGTVSEVRRDLV